MILPCHRIQQRLAYTTSAVGIAATPERFEEGCPTSVLAFNEGVRCFCPAHPYSAGAALLGVIEHLYVGISARIARLIRVEQGWVAEGAQRHYELHAELDVSHARELFDLAEPGWAHARPEIAQALALGAHHFWLLYASLLPADASLADSSLSDSPLAGGAPA